MLPLEKFTSFPHFKLPKIPSKNVNNFRIFLAKMPSIKSQKMLQFSLISIFLLLLIQIPSQIWAFRTQASGIKGQLFCAGKPASGVLVKLFDEDDGPDPDDELDSGYTDSAGRFELSGSTMELTNIDPELRIYHDCNMHVPLCKREWIIGIPDKYISAGTHPKKIMDLGTVNLDVELENESRDCIH